MTRRAVHAGTPWRLDRRGHTAAVDVDAYLRGLVEAVLFTRPGERLHRPDFGTGLDRLVFAPAGDELARTAQALVHGSLQQWLGDLVRIEEVTVEAAEARLDVRVTYVPLGIGSESAGRQVLAVSNELGSAP
ncbi:GPW/gp25 family protein [Actinomycetospora flava]|uniref:GPW/gp25 family protein n=1 Tax=Actinomycetospora flava TaxID=3129232 RepID=A0ABU8M6S4_9PSEU